MALRRSQVVLWDRIFDLSRSDLGAGYAYRDLPGQGDYIVVAVMRPLRRLRSEGLFLPVHSYDLYINLTGGAYSIGGADTSAYRWAHGKFFQLLSTGGVRIVASYLVLTDRLPRVRSYYAFGSEPVTTLRFTYDYRPVRPVKVNYVYFDTPLSGSLVPYARYVFDPDVCVAEVEIR